MEERLVVAVPVCDGQVGRAAGDPAGVLAAEVLADRLFGLGAAAVAEVELDGAPHLVADVPAGAVEDLGRARVLEPDRSWTDGWRDHARAWRAGRFLVRPPWLPPEPLAAGGIDLVVDPGDAFGSGSHPTTRACLALLDGAGWSGPLVRPGSRVLDVGCGSGILAVAAALLGAGEVVAVDVDPAAVAAAAAVVRDNGVGDRVLVLHGSVEQAGGRYDLVLANLLVPVVEQLGGLLVAGLASGGLLVVGGLLAGHRDRALAALAGTRPVAERTDDGWLTLVVQAPAGD